MDDAARQKLKEERQKAGHMWPVSMSEVQWEVEPLDSWLPNAPNGLLRHGPGDECRLVRLIDLAVWLGDEYPRKEVIRRLIPPLYQNGADPWGFQLFVINGQGYAVRLFDRFHPSLEPDAVDCWADFCEPDSVSEYGEHVNRNYSPRDVVGVIGRMFEYAWPGVGADPNADTAWRARRVIEANKRRNERAKAFPDMQHQAASSDMFSEERLHMMRALGRLAVPVPIAYTLWGWGRVPAAVALPVAVPSAPAAPQAVLTAADVTDWPTLCRYRLQFVGIPFQSRPPWVRAHVEILAVWLQSEHAAGRGRGALVRAAQALEFSKASAVSRLLGRHRFDSEGQEVVASLDSAWHAKKTKKKAA